MTDEISTRLQQVRQLYGLSQRELAKRAGVTNSSISMIEQGRVSPSISSLEKLLSGIPMTVKDFFNLDFDNQSRHFYRGYEIYEGSREGVDCYRLTHNKPGKQNQLIYQVFSPASHTGDSMLVSPHECCGFVVQGSLEVTINLKRQVLDAGDGFVIEALYPYRLCNKTDQKAIVVINNLLPNSMLN